MARTMLKIAAGAAALAGLSAAAVTTAGAANAATTPSWTSVGPSGAGGTVTAVTDVIYSGGKVAEYAFAFNGNRSSMWARSASESWAHSGIPGIKVDETVIAAKALTANKVVFLTTSGVNQGRLLEVQGHTKKVGSGTEYWYTWSVLKTFNARPAGLSVLTADDIWVFGAAPAAHQAPLGVVHFNGKTWTRVSTTYATGSAASARDVWAASGTTLEHWNGAKWTPVSIAGLLTSKDAVVSTIFTGSGGAPYALVSENGQTKPEAGPLLILEYNGHAWQKVATAAGITSTGEAAGDGASGLWISAEQPGFRDVLLHFHNGSHTVTTTSIPGATGATGGGIDSIAQLPGTTRELVGGSVGPDRAKIWYYS